MRIRFLQNVWSTAHGISFPAGTEADVDFAPDVVDALLRVKAIEVVAEDSTPKPKPKNPGPVHLEE